ncbi:hypothetical protein DUNSADRAFT_1268 [Dunaliella salina]|uniref:Encoded protein n=1 Tax=Dunaliella salina TaxID=3046 RepID=A0ABQ7GXA3_DUNSA|nr:hypothetical protein DUNSADRAFT_1268 [Dunaliella salina]|eukprot:KAF5839234.1 hypothetical protein DUNSADRAFT_1268 [Dunaliella salina]
MEGFEGGLVGVIVLQHRSSGAGVDAATAVVVAIAAGAHGHGRIDGNALGIVFPVPTSQLPEEGTLGNGVRQYLIHFKVDTAQCAVERFWLLCLGITLPFHPICQ